MSAPITKITTFLTKDRNPDIIKKNIHYSKYVNYEKELCEFCLLVNEHEHYDELKEILKQLCVADFCENPNMYIKAVSNSNYSIIEIKKILKDLITLHDYQRKSILNTCPWPQASISLVYQHGKEEFEASLQNYGYFLYQEDSPIVYSAQRTFDDLIAKSDLTEVNKEIYEHYLSDIERKLKIRYKRLVNQFNSLPDSVYNNYKFGRVLDTLDKESIKAKSLRRK